MPEKEKRPRGRPVVNSTPINLRLPPDLLAKLDAARIQVEPEPSRPEFIRQIIEDRVNFDVEEPPASDEQQAAADPAAPIDPDQLPPAWIRKAAARFLLWGARLIRNRPGSNAIRLAQADFYERLAEIALDGRLPPKPLPKQD